jgi:hypothetical protein
MSFRQSQHQLVAALRAGTFEHEMRDVLSEKNLLAVGEVTVEEVIEVVSRARGGDHTESPHHWDPETTVHVYRPVIDGVRWYIKAYFLNPPGGSAVFISVHR